ncbi:hypothetical protein [Thalassotalea profundi]|uniref:Uncharacterized protein n=1 Tax=Thalassotalea profundi TaxID=2036687 RepID=A0ABQ3IH79_9GAMM|nr:hypothetical protein [Thalassotalea profundi]GHE81243.1 hypothetical protein GCM10011501_06700 [Thalassotalea profundi]
MTNIKPIMVSIAMSLTTLSVHSATPELDDMYKQLKIMNNIIRSSAVDRSKSNVVELSSVNSTYLKGQGIVFTINSSSRYSTWRNQSFNFSLPEVPEFPEVSFGTPNVSNFDLPMNEKALAELTTNALEEAAESYELAIESMESQQEKYRELRESQRELHYRAREIERETRDIDYQLRLAEKDEKEKLLSKKEKFSEKRDALEKKSKELRKKAVALKKAQDQKRQKQLEERGTYYSKLALSLADTFCLYGNGLKALPKNENVSVILKSGGDQDKSRFKDKIYVFSKQDISSCSADKISAEQLLTKGFGYQF